MNYLKLFFWTNIQYLTLASVMCGGGGKNKIKVTSSLCEGPWQGFILLMSFESIASSSKWEQWLLAAFGTITKVSQCLIDLLRFKHTVWSSMHWSGLSILRDQAVMVLWILTNKICWIFRKCFWLYGFLCVYYSEDSVLRNYLLLKLHRELAINLPNIGIGRLAMR